MKMWRGIFKPTACSVASASFLQNLPSLSSASRARCDLDHVDGPLEIDRVRRTDFRGADVLSGKSFFFPTKCLGKEN